jgi:hypothetical protein
MRTLYSLVSLIGIAIIPFTVSQKHRVMRELHSLVVMLMISFAVGALIGDAGVSTSFFVSLVRVNSLFGAPLTVLHLMPEVLEVHSHSGGGHDEHHEEEEEDHDVRPAIPIPMWTEI